MKTTDLKPQALSATAVVSQLTQLNGNAAHGWRLLDGALDKRFEFDNFYAVMAFANAVAWIAHQKNHHPDLALAFGHCHVRFSTHDVSGISGLDFVCAAAVDALVA